ncbi:MAG: hypothetical protein J7619_16055 [Dyadobacter sp.]|uniref:hypothetical protein n=1 Tax=Dyadobacter sp. TaxID=1914288 RepID=UPI001AFD322B|nr:hypothetical protein [Dyadobacter sp.]MBO9614219.1 hypothetical protein [Dyadobacter sp.]
MKPKSFLLITLIVLIASTCHPEGPDCHHRVVLENASSDSVIFALQFYNLTYQNLTRCGLDGEVLPPNSKLDWGGFRTCWENRISNGKSLQIIKHDLFIYKTPLSVNFTKPKLCSLLLPAILTASTCHREGPNCHHNIIFKNSSSGTIIYSLKGSNGSGLCSMIIYSNANPSEEVILDLPRYCWEQELVRGRTAEMYVIDSGKFNTGTGFYDCDSLPIKNKVLKHYELTLDDLKKANFTIVYE